MYRSQQHSDFPSNTLLALVLGLFCLTYLSCRILVFSSSASLERILWRTSRSSQAEAGGPKNEPDIDREELFHLEKRAFLSKTWLFVCHRSKFERVGDYQTYDVAGIAFFVVLGRDLQPRAFHNVCRHRAYTVVRRSCGSSTRFSCKYHGWQYDDLGKLMKAPKFDAFPGFNMEENGLFQIKLITTREGFVFVNFDAGARDLGIGDVRSQLDIGPCSWLNGTTIECKLGWKDLANNFPLQAAQSRPQFRTWPMFRAAPRVQMLGPMSLIRELEKGLWCTMVLLPSSSTQTMVRCDLYAGQGIQVRPQLLEKWKLTLQQELSSVSDTVHGRHDGTTRFSYQCGGRTIDLSAIVIQHQRQEQIAKRKLQPAVRVSGTDDIDTEAEAISDALESIAGQPGPEQCSRVSSFSAKMDW